MARWRHLEWTQIPYLLAEHVYFLVGKYILGVSYTEDVAGLTCDAKLVLQRESLQASKEWASSLMPSFNGLGHGCIQVFPHRLSVIRI
jgi:hypothetical protein